MAKKKSTSNAVSVDVRRLSFGSPPVVSPDDLARYEELLARICAHVQPSDPIEEMYTRDVADLTFELVQYRNRKARILQGALPRALAEKLTPFMDGRHRFGAAPSFDTDRTREPTPVMELVNKWMRHDPKAIKRVAELLEQARFTMEDVRAHALFLELGTIERFDRLIADLEERRNGAMREIERYRERLAIALKAAVHEPEEAEFKVLTSHSA